MPVPLLIGRGFDNHRVAGLYEDPDEDVEGLLRTRGDQYIGRLTDDTAILRECGEGFAQVRGTLCGSVLQHCGGIRPAARRGFGESFCVEQCR